MSYVLRPISTLRKIQGDRLIGFDEANDIYSVMMWNGRAWTTIPGGFEFRPTHWFSLPASRYRAPRQDKQEPK